MIHDECVSDHPALCHFLDNLGHKMYKCPDESHSTLYSRNWWDSVTLLWISCIFLHRCTKCICVFLAFKLNFWKNIKFINILCSKYKILNSAETCTDKLFNISDLALLTFGRDKTSNAQLIMSVFYIHIMILWLWCFPCWQPLETAKQWPANLHC